MKLGIVFLISDRVVTMSEYLLHLDLFPEQGAGPGSLENVTTTQTGIVNRLFSQFKNCSKSAVIIALFSGHREKRHVLLQLIGLRAHYPFKC